MLESMDFWVCEKSDGVRVLVFIVMNGMSGNQEVWLVSPRVSGTICHALVS
jgi:mRNA guanylyltransferase